MSVKVRKGGAQDETYEVDGISGATVTADGVSKMMYEGLELYLPYNEKVKSENEAILNYRGITFAIEKYTSTTIKQDSHG